MAVPHTHVAVSDVDAAVFGLDDDGNLVVTGFLMNFIVTDETGREADMGIVYGTKALRFIITQYNDVVPGYDAYRPDCLG